MLEQFTFHVYYPKQYISNKGLNEVRMLEFESNETSSSFENWFNGTCETVMLSIRLDIAVKSQGSY